MKAWVLSGMAIALLCAFGVRAAEGSGQWDELTGEPEYALEPLTARPSRFRSPFQPEPEESSERIAQRYQTALMVEGERALRHRKLVNAPCPTLERAIRALPLVTAEGVRAAVKAYRGEVFTGHVAKGPAIVRIDEQGVPRVRVNFLVRALTDLARGLRSARCGTNETEREENHEIHLDFADGELGSALR